MRFFKIAFTYCLLSLCTACGSAEDNQFFYKQSINAGEKNIYVFYKVWGVAGGHQAIVFSPLDNVDHSYFTEKQNESLDKYRLIFFSDEVFVVNRSDGLQIYSQDYAVPKWQKSIKYWDGVKVVVSNSIPPEVRVSSGVVRVTKQGIKQMR